MPNTSPARLANPLELGRGDGFDVRPTLLRVLTDLYLQRSVHTPEDESYYTELALRLLDAVNVSERAVLAMRLARYSSPPRALIERLARDVIEVARPILEHPRWLTLAEPTAGHPGISAAHSRIPLPAGPAPAVNSDYSAATEAHELSELFYAAGPLERRVILASLDYAVLIPTAPLSGVARPDIWRLESAIFECDSEALARELEPILGLSRSQLHRVMSDELGEAIVVIAKAINLPVDVMTRSLTRRDCSLTRPANRIGVLAALYNEMSFDAARRLITIWRTAAATEVNARREGQCSRHHAIEEMAAGTILHLDDPDVRIEP